MSAPTPEYFAQKLVDWVSTVTQLDPEKGELPNAEDWRRNAEKLFALEAKALAAAAREDGEKAMRERAAYKVNAMGGRPWAGEAAVAIRALKTGEGT